MIASAGQCRFRATEDNAATGVNGDESDNNASNSGAAYLFVRNGTNWTQQAYLKASNTEAADNFGGGSLTSPGTAVAVSGDTVVIGALFEDSGATGVNGDQSDYSAFDSGAAYIFTGLGIGPRLTLAPDASGGYFIRFNGAPDVTYTLERATRVDGGWQTIDTQTVPASGLIEYHDTMPPNGQAFYRVAVP